MRTLSAAVLASALMFSAPLALADDLVIAPEIGVKFHNEVKTKKIKVHKVDSDLKVGVVIPADVEFYDVPEDVVVATPALKTYKYAYVNEHVYVVEPGSRKIIAVIE